MMFLINRHPLLFIFTTACTTFDKTVCVSVHESLRLSCFAAFAARSVFPLHVSSCLIVFNTLPLQFAELLTDRSPTFHAVPPLPPQHEIYISTILVLPVSPRFSLLNSFHVWSPTLQTNMQWNKTSLWSTLHNRFFFWKGRLSSKKIRFRCFARQQRATVNFSKEHEPTQESVFFRL